ncbi:MAG: hypothetical protein Kow0031_12140 [Anaerolineae bacterium]
MKAPDSNLPNRKYAQSIALFLFLLAIYLLSYTPRINSSDGLAMFATAESIVRRGALDIEQIRWMGLQQGTYGLDGLLYSRKGIGVPLGLLPLVAPGLALPWFGPVSASLLFNAIVTALTAVLLLAYVQALGYPARVGLLTALAFGLATLAWPYAKSLFSDPFSGLLLLAAALALLKTGEGAGAQGRRGEHHNSPAPLLFWPFLAGLLLGWKVATRYAEAIFLPVFGLLLLYYLYKQNGEGETPPSPPRLRHWLPPLVAFATPILVIGLALMAFNWSRYGDPLNTGYLASETFSAIWLDGIAGQLISPGRGLLLFSPLLLLSFGGVVPLLRRRPAESLLALGIILIHLLLYGKWFMWHGGYAWGPRFLVPTLPFWALFLAPVIRFAIDDLRFTNGNMPAKPLRITHYAIRFSIPLLFAISFLIQLPLLLVDFSAYMGWLLESGLPLFARETFFEWGYSPWPALGQFISAGALDLAWAWGGVINWGLLAALVANAVVCGAALVNYELRMTNDESPNRQIGHPPSQLTHTLLIAAGFTTLAAVTLLLGHTHTLPPVEVQQVVDALNRDVGRSDAVITNGPALSEPFAERYAGRAPVLGLNSGGLPLPADIERRLAEVIAGHRQVWWLPNGLPAADSAVAQTLAAQMAPARREEFGGQQLALFVAPPPGEPSPQTAQFGDSIRLGAALVPASASRGEALAVELHWQAIAPVAADYHVFVHLVNGAGQVVAQADGQPAQWTRPTSTWAEGETVTDRHGLWLPAETPPGAHTLRVGLYLPASGERLLLPGGADAVEFAVEVN